MPKVNNRSHRTVPSVVAAAAATATPSSGSQRTLIRVRNSAKSNKVFFDNGQVSMVSKHHSTAGVQQGSTRLQLSKRVVTESASVPSRTEVEVIQQVKQRRETTVVVNDASGVRVTLQISSGRNEDFSFDLIIMKNRG